MRHTCSVALKVQVTGSWDRGLEKASHHDEVARSGLKSAAAPPRALSPKKTGRAGAGECRFLPTLTE
jgi:hypothetical protein